jgi:hypothetical protein
MKLIRILFLIFFVQFNLNAQTVDSAYFRAQAIGLKQPGVLPSGVYNLLGRYKLIMIGEKSGTNEPAMFLTGLAELFTYHGDSIQVGFEIPPDQMNEFLKLKTDSSVYKSDFFSKTSNDNRANSAWATAILKLNTNKYVSIFFYDVNTEESKTPDDRNKLMYLKIKHHIQAHPKWKTITFGDNVHNMIRPYKEENTTAIYLLTDPELSLKQGLCTLNHNFQKGQTLGGQWKLGLPDSYFPQLPGYTNYLFLYKNEQVNIYNGIFFTKVARTATCLNKKRPAPIKPLKHSP